MNATEIFNMLKNHKGQNLPVTWTRVAKTKRGCIHTIIKTTKAFVRTGINFANLATVKNGIEAGERGEVQKLPWGQWREGFFPFIIDHNGVEYVRLYPASFENLEPQVQWTMNGAEVSFEEVKPFLLVSEYPKDDKPECFTVKAANINKIN